jgi:hypothetical protein
MKSMAIRRMACATLACIGMGVLGGCGGSGGGATSTPTPDQGTISGSSVSSSDGSVEIATTATVSGIAAASSTPAQPFTLNNVPISERIVVRLSAPGHVDQIKVVSVRSGVVTYLRSTLVPVGTSATVDPTAAVNVSVPGSTAQVSAPANAFVRADNGAAPSGSLTIAVTPIDPASDPARMPGDYTTLAGGVERAIESFGAIGVTIQDAGGNRYNLASGKTATIRIPLSSRGAGAAPATIPLFYLDEGSGRWVEEGTAALAGTGASRYYEGTISHFSFWNADQIVSTVFVSGCTEFNGQRTSNRKVQADGIDYIGVAQALTDANGNFRVPMRINSRALLTGRGSGVEVTAPVVVGPSATDIVLGTCLQERDAAALVPSFFTQPQSVTTEAGTFATFSVIVDGRQSIGLQWRRNGVNIAGATGTTLTTFVTAADNGAVYSVVATNFLGSATSNNATVTVGAPNIAPQIRAQPASITVTVGQSATFSVDATGAAPLSYQWRRNGTAIGGATAASYVTPATTIADNGAVYSVAVLNGIGNLVSAGATLTVVVGATPADTYKGPLAQLFSGTYSAGCVNPTGTATGPILIGANGDASWDGGQLALAPATARVTILSTGFGNYFTLSDEAINREVSIASFPTVPGASSVAVTQIAPAANVITCTPGFTVAPAPLPLNALVGSWFNGLNATLTCNVRRTGSTTSSTEALGFNVTGGTITLGTFQLSFTGPRETETAAAASDSHGAFGLGVGYGVTLADGSSWSMGRQVSGLGIGFNLARANGDFYVCLGNRN